MCPDTDAHTFFTKFSDRQTGRRGGGGIIPGMISQCRQFAAAQEWNNILNYTKNDIGKNVLKC